MKTLLALTIALFCVTALNAQSRSNSEIEQQLKSAGANATVHFDVNSKVTTLKGVAENFSDSDTKRSGAKAMNFAVGALYAGDKIERSLDPLTLSFWIMSGGKARFGDSQSLIAMANGETADLGSGRYTFRRDGMEYINFNLTRDQVAKLTNATTWVLGGKQFVPTGSQRQLLRAVLAATQVN
jgi:hypothetical protein